MIQQRDALNGFVAQLFKRIVDQDLSLRDTLEQGGNATFKHDAGF